MSALCECGHDESWHGLMTGKWIGESWVGPCSAFVDTRPVTVGGDGLTPCGCKRFVAAAFAAFGNVPAGLYGGQETR